MTKPSTRIIGYDFARALAILGMIIVNYKLALVAGESPRWLAILTNSFESGHLCNSCWCRDFFDDKKI